MLRVRRRRHLHGQTCPEVGRRRSRQAPDTREARRAAARPAPGSRHTRTSPRCPAHSPGSMLKHQIKPAPASSPVHRNMVPIMNGPCKHWSMTIFVETVLHCARARRSP